MCAKCSYIDVTTALFVFLVVVVLRKEGGYGRKTGTGRERVIEKQIKEINCK